MDMTINTTTRDYDGTYVSTLQNAVYLRLTTPKGEWWADNEFGSLLHLIKREKDVARVGLLAQQYASEALQPIIDSKRAESITVTAHQPHNGMMILSVEVLDNSNHTHVFKHSVPVI